MTWTSKMAVAALTLFSLLPLAKANTAQILSALPGVQVLKLPGQTSETIGLDKKTWAQSKESADTELYTLKKKPDARAAVLHDGNGSMMSFTFYELQKSSQKKLQNEMSGTLFYANGKVDAFTSCKESDATKQSAGRICVTTTPKLCQALKDGSGITPPILEEMSEFEQRALAYILTLRGPDHQIENLAKTGNRLGLKTALQTTKGQLLALARQVEKESTTGPNSSERLVASTKVASKPTPEDKLARTVLEESIPRLKQSCLDTGFAQ